MIAKPFWPPGGVNLMLRPKLSHPAAALLSHLEQPMRGMLTAAIDRLAATDGAVPPSDPIPLLFPQRQTFLEDPEKPGQRWRIVFCTYPEQRLLHIPVIELAPVF